MVESCWIRADLFVVPVKAQHDEAVNPMTTIQLTQTPVQATAQVTVPVCACGQDLDCSHGRHCPRCGRTLYGEPVAMIPAA